jgi:hypothetical protein
MEKLWITCGEGWITEEKFLKLSRKSANNRPNPVENA